MGQDAEQGTPDRPNEEIHQGEMSHGGQRGDARYGYGRSGGSVADTGTRTDVPVGIEQVESSAVSPPSQQTALERQGDPPEGHDTERGRTDTKLGVE